MGVLLFLASLLFLLGGIFFYGRASKAIDRIEAMLESAMDGSFSENDFSESKLSRLESRMCQYLAQGATARRQIAVEKQAVQQLVSDISHQSKTPISNILLYAQLLEEKQGLDQEARDFARLLENQVEKLKFLIQALIKMSRLENGIIEVAPRRHSLRELFGQIGKSFEEQARKGRLVIGGLTDFPAESLEDGFGGKGEGLSANPDSDSFAFFDFKWTLEAISNLIDNGLKYTPEKGVVTVSWRDYEMFVRIDIEDTGMGIPEEETAKIFCRFYRSSQAQDRDGVGGGLFLAREVVVREGGYIKVSSEVGKGSLFSVFLPKMARSQEAGAGEGKGQGGGRPAH